ncbi:MAG: NUDIX hydrolase [Anaerolineales bacterium]|nr:NUDIX hydrolase [Anaerolineales bacterium]
MKKDENVAELADGTYRKTRYQDAILIGCRLLLIRHQDLGDGHSYWLLPGGERIPGESPEACVAREMFEETGLIVRVEELALDFPSPAGDLYVSLKTYRCVPVGGEAAQGFEPELGAASRYAIAEVRWLELSEEGALDLVAGDAFPHPQLQAIRVTLGCA